MALESSIQWQEGEANGSVSSTATTELVAAPGAGKRLVIIRVQLATSATGEFTGIAILDDTAGGTQYGPAMAMTVKQIYNSGAELGFRMRENKPICLTRTAVAGSLSYSIQYRIQG